MEEKPSSENLIRQEYIKRQIQGAIKATIQIHGPISNDYIGSVMKRIMGALAEHFRELEKMDSELGRREPI